MRKLLCVLSLFVMLSCENGNNGSVASGEVADEEVVTEDLVLNEAVAMEEKVDEKNIDVHEKAPPSTPKPLKPVERKLIRNGSMSFEVDDVNATRKTIAALAIEFDGYISSDRHGKAGDNPRYIEVVRVPGANFDGFIARVEALAKQIDDKNFNVDDVTEEYIDRQSRLVAKKEIESRFREIVKQAKTIEEILDVERQIGIVRGEVEQIQGKMKYISSKVSFSTVTLTYYENSPVAVPGIASKFADSFLIGWDAFVAFLVAITRTWPFLLILALAAWLVMRRKRKEPAQVIQ